MKWVYKAMPLSGTSYLNAYFYILEIQWISQRRDGIVFYLLLTSKPHQSAEWPTTTFVTDGRSPSATCHFQEQADHQLLLEGIHISFVLY